MILEKGTEFFNANIQIVIFERGEVKEMQYYER